MMIFQARIRKVNDVEQISIIRGKKGVAESWVITSNLFSLENENLIMYVSIEMRPTIPDLVLVCRKPELEKAD